MLFHTTFTFHISDKYIITSDKSSNDLYIYHGDATSLFQSGAVTHFVLPLSGQSMILKFDTNVEDATLYYLDLVSSCFYSITNFSSVSANVNKMHCGISQSTGSTIAYDWVAHNMYWSDGLFHWIAVQPIDTTDSQMYRVIVQKDTEDISALAVDPIKRLMFWGVLCSKTKIRKFCCFQKFYS